MLNQGMMSSKDQTWETPQDLFDKLNLVFNFEVDVCAVPETAKCNTYYTPEIDGLKQTWGGDQLDESSVWERTSQMD